MHANTWVDHLKELTQSKDIFQIKRTGLHAHFEATSGHIVPTKEALCPPNTHFHHLPYAGSSIHANQSQFSARSVPWSDSSHGCKNAGVREYVKTQDQDFSFHCQPRLTSWQHPQRNTRGFGHESISFISAKILMCSTRMVSMNLHYKRSHGSTKKVCAWTLKRPVQWLWPGF